MTTYYDGGTGSPAAGMSAAGVPTAEVPTASAWGPGAHAPVLPRDEFTGDLVCTGIAPVTHDVVDVRFRAADGGSLPYSPGQYYTFTFPGLGPGGEGLDRCYSVSSAAGGAGAGIEELTITVKRVPGGPVSTFVHERLRVGDTLRGDGPYGVFGSDVRPGAGALYLSAGSGITPFLSMMRTRAAPAVGGGWSGPLWSSVVHIHAAHAPADLIHRAELLGFSGRDQTTVIPVCSTDSPAESWAGVRGRLTAQELAVLVPDLLEREVLVCGPTAFMEAVVAMVVELGVPAERIHLESYVFGERPRVPAQASAGVFSIEFRGAGRTVQCPAGTTILAAAREAGIAHPSSCSEGVCGTCKATMLSGEVDMDHQGGIRPREVREGKILPCCSVPRTDVVLE